MLNYDLCLLNVLGNSNHLCTLRKGKLVFVCYSGFDNFADEIGISRESSLKKGMSLDVEYDEKDLVKVNNFIS